MTIRMDIVQVEGRAIEGVKILGILPDTIADSDFNVYVRWMPDGSVRADRSDTDRMIVAASSRNGKYAAFRMLMENLSRHYGMPVVVEVDPGTSGPQVAKMTGAYIAEVATPVCGHCGNATVGRDDQMIPFPHECATIEDIRRFTTCRCAEIFAEGPQFTERSCPCGAVFPAVERVRTAVDVVWFDTIAELGLKVTRTDDVSTDFRVIGSWRDGFTLSALELACRVRDGLMAKVTDDAVSEGDTVYRERSGHTGVVTNVMAGGDVEVQFMDGSSRRATLAELCNDGYEVIPADDMEALKSADAPRRLRKHKPTKATRARRGGA